MDMFDYLHPCSITMIYPPGPINLYDPQCTASLQSRIHDYKLMVRRAMAQMVAGLRLFGKVWVWDDTQFSTTEYHALNEVKVASC